METAGSVAWKFLEPAPVFCPWSRQPLPHEVASTPLATVSRKTVIPVPVQVINYNLLADTARTSLTALLYFPHDFEFSRFRKPSLRTTK